MAANIVCSQVGHWPPAETIEFWRIQSWHVFFHICWFKVSSDKNEVSFGAREKRRKQRRARHELPDEMSWFKRYLEFWSVGDVYGISNNFILRLYPY